MKVLKGRCVIARGATPGMGSNDISIAQCLTDKKIDEVVWCAKDRYLKQTRRINILNWITNTHYSLLITHY